MWKMEDIGCGCEYKWVDNEEHDERSTNMIKHYTWRHSVQYPYKQENNLANLSVTKVVTHNDRVVIVYFNDGSFTKAVCSENDTFDIDVGIQVCLLKKIFGTKQYYANMKNIHRLMDQQEAAKEQEKAEKKARREKQQKIEAKRQRKIEASKQAFRDDVTRAVIAALEYEAGKDVDDLK